MTDLTAEEARRLLDYDPSTGELRWKVSINNRVKVGSVAGRAHCRKGYMRIGIYGKRYFSHRVAWLITHGRWPKPCIDHINGNRDDNRLENLRECTVQENNQNILRRRKNVKSPYTGVYQSGNRWEARISYRKKLLYLGVFSTPEKAHAAYLAKKRKL